MNGYTDTTKDPNAILITDEEMAKLLATKPVDAEVGYITTDDFDEEEKIPLN